MVTSIMHKWLVFITAYLSTFLYVGFIFSIGSIFIEIREAFNATRAETSVIQSTAYGVAPGSAFVAGVLIPKVGLVKSSIIFAIFASVGVLSTYFTTTVWHMTVTLGVIYGFGTTNAFICSTLAVGLYFTGRQRIIMLSIHGTCVPFGSMLFAYILPYMCSYYGYRGALLIIGGVFLNGIPCCLLWKEPNNDPASIEARGPMEQFESECKVKVTETENRVTIKTATNEAKTFNDIYYIRKFPVLYNHQHTKQITLHKRRRNSLGNQEVINTLLTSLRIVLKNPSFVYFWIGTTLAIISLNTMLVFVADIFRDKFLSESNVTLGLILFGLCNIVGRMIPGIVMLIQRLPIFACPFLSSVLMTGFTAGFVLSTSRFVVLCFYGLIGTAYGMIQSMYGVVNSRLVGLNNISVAMGVCFTTTGILNAITGPVSGYARDTLDTYDIPIYTGIGLSALGSVICMYALIQECMEQWQTSRRSKVFDLTSM